MVKLSRLEFFLFEYGICSRYEILKGGKKKQINLTLPPVMFFSSGLFSVFQLIKQSWSLAFSKPNQNYDMMFCVLSFNLYTTLFNGFFPKWLSIYCLLFYISFHSNTCLIIFTPNKQINMCIQLNLISKSNCLVYISN